MFAFAIVSFAVPAPVVNTLVVTVATKLGSTSPLAATVTVPSFAVTELLLVLAVPRLALAGTLIDSAALAVAGNAKTVSATSALTVLRRSRVWQVIPPE